MSETTTRLELTYRAVARQVRKVEDNFKDVVDQITALGEVEQYKVETVDDPSLYTQIELDQVEAKKKEGLLVAEGEQPTLIIHCWRIILTEPTWGVDDWFGEVEQILKKVGPVFTNIEVIQSVFTDVGPQ